MSILLGRPRELNSSCGERLRHLVERLRGLELGGDGGSFGSG